MDEGKKLGSRAHAKNGQINMPDFMKSLAAPPLFEYSITNIREYHKNDCNLHYTAEGSHEILMWGLGLMCLEYSLEVFKDKMIKGHCNAHGEPCEDGSAFHNRVLHDCLSSYHSIIDRENEVVSP